MRKQRTISILILALVAALMIVFLGPVVTIRKDNGWTCAYTGSHNGSTTWLGCITTSEWYKPSPLEEWLARNGRLREHKWVRTMGTTYSLFGRTGSSHASAPAVHYFPPELQERFVAHASAEDVDVFLRLLKQGTPHEAQEAVDAINERMIKEM